MKGKLYAYIRFIMGNIWQWMKQKIAHGYILYLFILPSFFIKQWRHSRVAIVNTKTINRAYFKNELLRRLKNNENKPPITTIPIRIYITT